MSTRVGMISRATLTQRTQRCVPKETIIALLIITGTTLVSMRSTRQGAPVYPVLPGGSMWKRATPGIRTWSRIRIAYKVSMTHCWPMVLQPWACIARQLNGKALLAVGTISGHPGVPQPGRPRNKLGPMVLDTSLQAGTSYRMQYLPRNVKVDYDVSC